MLAGRPIELGGDHSRLHVGELVDRVDVDDAVHVPQQQDQTARIPDGSPGDSGAGAAHRDGNTVPVRPGERLRYRPRSSTRLGSTYSRRCARSFRSAPRADRGRTG